MVFKVVAERARRREILIPLRVGEVIDQDGRVVESEHRLGEGRTSWARDPYQPTWSHWARGVGVPELLVELRTAWCQL